MFRCQAHSKVSRDHYAWAKGEPCGADEQFDVDEEELERTLSLGTAEKLRDAGVPAMQSLLDMQDNYHSPRTPRSQLWPRQNVGCSDADRWP